MLNCQVSCSGAQRAWLSALILSFITVVVSVTGVTITIATLHLFTVLFLLSLPLLITQAAELALQALEMGFAALKDFS